ncbi:energy-coupling factor transporter transmembrane protein EcfT [Nakamurella sp. YIM 132087]|uniref:Energy-coupling factor transporter transmembrane protein EcfT n=1 Tax=Nakamurella alba TaxID=2665158 RepID=A0A7K1FEN7_9ACTN|nr:energy-coupling factor transporter transmembrane protein EcfT [Nakamurella alba]MTD12575.1 energy-coupling factor transporter transmembrane protein EcfT [Nakamurella alba]
MIGLYHPGHSLLHRLPAGPKLLLLLVAVVTLTLLRQLWQLGIAALVVLLLIPVTRLPWRLVWQQLKPMRWFVPIVFGFQWLLVDLRSAVMVCGGLVLAVALAALVTLTTRVTAMLDLMQKLLRPLRRFGVDPDRVGLVLALTIRCVPLLSEIVRQVQEARISRGVGFSLQALVVPVVVRALRSADAIGDALVARGVDD